MRVIYRNLTVMAAGAMLVAFAWVYGGARADLSLSYVPWLWALLLEMMLFFPGKRSGETILDARKRVWRDLRADPLTWISVALVILLLIPFANRGLCAVCDAAKIAAGADPSPTIPFLPFCVDRSAHLSVFQWFVAAMTMMLAVKHSLTLGGKRRLLEIVVWNGAALTVFGLVQQALGAHAPFWVGEPYRAYFFSTFGYANACGDYFTALLLVSLALWRYKVQEVEYEAQHADLDGNAAKKSVFWPKNYILIASVFLYLGSIMTLSRSAIVLSTILSVFIMVHTAILRMSKLHRIDRVRTLAVIILTVAVMAVVATVITPESVRREISTVKVTESLDRLSGRNDYQVSAAISIFTRYPLFGCGGWGFQHFSLPYTPKSVSQFFGMPWMRGGSNVHNDYLQFLCEHGLVGFGLVMAAILLLLFPVERVWRTLIKSVRFVDRRKGPPSPRALFVFPAPALALLFAIFATLIHAFGDCPLRYPAILVLLFAELPAIECFLPKLEIREEPRARVRRHHHQHHHHHHEHDLNQKKG